MDFWIKQIKLQSSSLGVAIPANHYHHSDFVDKWWNSDHVRARIKLDAAVVVYRYWEKACEAAVCNSAHKFRWEGVTSARVLNLAA